MVKGVTREIATWRRMCARGDRLGHLSSLLKMCPKKKISDLERVKDSLGVMVDG